MWPKTMWVLTTWLNTVWLNTTWVRDTWLYKTWFYKNVLNASWFVWTVVVLFLGVNFLMPVLVWFLLGGRRVRFMRWVRKQAQKHS